MARTDEELAALGARWAEQKATYDTARRAMRKVVEEEAAEGAAEYRLARLLQLDRMTVRGWLGKR